METNQYLLIFEDCSLKIVNEIDDDLKQNAMDGYVQIIDITGAKDPRTMEFPGNEVEWQLIKQL